MFGYIVTNKPELKIREFDEYRSYYCGLCRVLKEKYGIAGQLSLTYDMTFVLLLLSGLYEFPVQKGMTRCVIHPVRKQIVRKNKATEYAADMNVLLSYYKCMDDWHDEKKLVKYAYAKLLKKSDKNRNAFYQKKEEAIKEALNQLSFMEKNGETDIDKVAGCSGKLMEEILVYQEDLWEGSLRKIGFYLGKFIYILDAFDDVEKDIKKGSYNPFAQKYQEESFEEDIRQMLLMMMTEACREFELLPIIKHGEILRNILYSGVWCRFEEILAKRKEERKKC